MFPSFAPWEADGKQQMPRAGETVVIVHNNLCVVSVKRKSTTVWTAVGDYMGQSILVEDQSYGAALLRWRVTAGHKLN